MTKALPSSHTREELCKNWSETLGRDIWVFWRRKSNAAVRCEGTKSWPHPCSN